MIDKKATLIPADCSRKIFVLGTGRSGTTWVGHILNTHPDIVATVEKSEIFTLVTTMAINPASRDRLFPQLVSYYQNEHASVYPRLYADKSHPNIWIADRLASVFPKALFLGIRRNVYATVASMIKHPGVMDWIYNWKNFPVPSEFLGTTKENIGEYRDLSIIGKCTMRWLSHTRQLEKLQMELGDRFLLVPYERLQSETNDMLLQVSLFLGLRSPMPVPKVKHESLERWKNELNKQDMSDIEDVITRFSVNPDDYLCG